MLIQSRWPRISLHILAISVLGGSILPSGAQLIAHGSKVHAFTTTASTLVLTGPSTVRLGSAITIKATGSGSTGKLNWSANGISGGNASVGSITAAGVYTAPSQITTATLITIGCQQAAKPTVNAKLRVSLQNPVPVLTSALVSSHNAFQFGINLVGVGFVPGAQVLVNGSIYPSTTSSSTSLQVVIAQASLQISSVGLQVVNPAPGTSSSSILHVQVPLLLATPTAAARLLDQATFGPTAADIQHVESVGLSGYLAEQFSTPATLMPLAPGNYSQLPSYCSDSFSCFVEFNWWNTALTAQDQLRQRVAFAESHVWSVSLVDVDARFIPYYLNTLSGDAFVNWRVLMKDVSLTGAMGAMLNMAGNNYLHNNQIADENFAREILQLFNLGPVLLNEDGTQQLDSSGNVIPTYSPDQIQALSRTLTGWGYSNERWSTPMMASEQYHDPGSKVLLNGVTLPRNQSADQDLEAALDNIFAHPNLPPFIASQLIQQLVKSAPSPQYVRRVADVFENNGRGVRGDMKTVITAVFMDPEARQDDDPFLVSEDVGRLREPIMWTTAVLRGLGAKPTVLDLSWAWAPVQTELTVGETPFAAPTVFGFFSPSYRLPGTTTIAPEFGVESTATIFETLSNAQQWVGGGYGSLKVNLSKSGQFGGSAIQGADPLLDQMNLVLMHGKMTSQMRSLIRAIIQGKDPSTMSRIAAYLIITSSAYKVQM